MLERATVVGVFTERNQAEQAITELHRAGFNDDQLGFAVRRAEYIEHTPTPEQPESAKGAAAGAVSGGVVGGVVGAAVALLIPGFGPAIAGGILGATFGGAAIGAATGGFIGALTSLGLSEEEAHYYMREFETGRVIVTVNAPGRAQDAIEILRHAGAYDASTTPVAQSAPAAAIPAQGEPAMPAESVASAVANSTATPVTPYAPDAALDPYTDAPTEKQPLVHHTISHHSDKDSVAHHEEAAERPNRNNIPMGTGM